MANGAEVQQARMTRVFSEADVMNIITRYNSRTGRSTYVLPLKEVVDAYEGEMTEEVIARSMVERMLREAVRCGRAGHGVPEPGQGTTDFTDRLRRACA